jgi:hypothetical protein
VSPHEALAARAVRARDRGTVQIACVCSSSAAKGVAYATGLQAQAVARKFAAQARAALNEHKGYVA